MTANWISLAVFGLALFPACRTTTRSIEGAPGGVIVVSRPTEAWELWDADHKLGSVIRYASEPDAARAYFSVRNELGQELGIVDVRGRSWRYRPHQRDPEWLGTGTIVDGIRRILSANSSAELRAIELGAMAETYSKTAPP